MQLTTAILKVAIKVNAIAGLEEGFPLFLIFPRNFLKLTVVTINVKMSGKPHQPSVKKASLFGIDLSQNKRRVSGPLQ
ncbi:hypothetical protein KIN_29430 [Litoreibacter roseus]|uniref:Uncharacterized protein n=1 Tax=Litoreibacter roseus TaxID=2601869 RepID=A0A6N6JKB2_9RHOB|nr:hypothetical protein KIN_29430 [Litoreibacter roseus]